MITKLKHNINQRLQSNRFLQNLAWLGMSEVFVRVTRLVTAIVLARLMDPIIFGLAALVLTINELIRVFNRNGIGAKIVQCSDEELHDITNTAYRLNFIFCIALFVLQCLLAYPLARFYDTPELVPMLQVLSVTYLLMPFGMVQASLVQRAQRLKTCAVIDGLQVGIDNLITTLLALAGLGAWAIVLPKFLTSPIWVIGYRRALKWAPSNGVWRFNLWQDVLKFGRYYLSIELLKTARLNLDNMVIARLLGMEALGIYYFARNAGLGFSLTLINAISSALYPNLCEVQNNARQLRARFVANLKSIILIAVPLISLQAGLAFIYVPIVFGEQWVSAVPILTLLCLSALPRPLAESASTLLLATGRINTDFKWNLIFTAIFVLSVTIAAQFSLLAVAITVLSVYVITHPIYFCLIWRKVFGATKASTNNTMLKSEKTQIKEEVSMLAKNQTVKKYHSHGIIHNKDMPLVSVVMPVYNVEAYIDQAVWSVLDQTYGNFELIIVDDQSPDNSIELIKEKYNDVRIRIISQKNRGLAGARNTGIRNAKGDYIALLDSDDFWQADKLQKQIRLMQTNPQCGVTFSASLFVDESGESLQRIQAPKKKTNYQAKDIFCRNPVGNGSAPIIRKNIFDQIAFTNKNKTEDGTPYLQYFDETLRQSEDVECWTRIALQTGTQFEYIDEPLTNYRLNNSGLSADVNAQFATWLKLLENTKAYAPEFVKQYGPIAKAFQYRYLARRSVFQAQGRNALKFMCLAFKSAPLGLFKEFKRTSETLVASAGLSLMPTVLQKKLVERVMAG